MVTLWDEKEIVRPALLEATIVSGLPLLSADEANRRVVELTMENIRLQAKVDEVELMKRYGA